MSMSLCLIHVKASYALRNIFFYCNSVAFGLCLEERERERKRDKELGGLDHSKCNGIPKKIFACCFFM